MARISISYRRADSATAGRISDRLIVHYGTGSVFMDVADILPGTNFRDRINEALAESDVLLAVVGPRWLDPRKRGHTTIHDENDWVRIEVEAALRRKLPIIPVLVQGGTMPKAAEMPDSLREFADIHAATVDSGEYFHDHMARLIRSIDYKLQGKTKDQVGIESARAASAPVATNVPDDRLEAEKPQGPNATDARSENPDTTQLETELPSTESPTVVDDGQGEGPANGPASTPRVIVHGDSKAEVSDTDRPVASTEIREPQPPTRHTIPDRRRQGQGDRRQEGRVTVHVEPVSAAGLLAFLNPRSRRNQIAAGIAVLCLGAVGVWWSQTNPPQEIAVAVPDPASPQLSEPAAPRPSSEQSVPVPADPPAAREQPRVTEQIDPRPDPPHQSLAGPVTADVSPACAPSPGKFFVAAGPVGGPSTRISIKPNLVDAYKVRDIAFSPDGAMLATAGDDGFVRLWDASSLKLVRTLKGHEQEVYSVTFWKDGTQLASASMDATVRIWNTASGDQLATFRAHVNGLPIRQYGVAYSPGPVPKYVVSVGDGGLIWTWDVQQQGLNRRDSDYVTTLRSLSFNPNASSEFATAGFDGKVRFYRQNRKIDASEPPYSGKVLRVAFSPDGSRVASAGNDKQNLRIWSARTSTSFQPYDGHTGYVVSVAWSANGKRLISGGGWRDKTVRIWNAETNQQVAQFAGHEADIESVAFHPKAPLAVSVSEDKTMKVWDVENAKGLLTVVAFGEREFAAYTPAGCYTGSPGVERMLRLGVEGTGNFEITADMRQKLFVPDGFARLMAGN